jgi:hypothetical protein
MKAVVAYLLLVAGLGSSTVGAAPLLFDYVAHVDSSDRPGAPAGTLLSGRFGYDPEQIRYQVGGDYFPEFSSAPMTARGSAGFSLSMDAQVIVVVPDFPTAGGGAIDNLILQSFVGESPNDWHMVLEFREPVGVQPWLGGSNALPTTFPDTLTAPWLQIYFTDEYDWVRTIDATLLSVSPAAPVPLPAAAFLFAPAMLLLGAIAARRRSYGSIKAVPLD